MPPSDPPLTPRAIDAADRLAEANATKAEAEARTAEIAAARAALPALPALDKVDHGTLTVAAGSVMFSELLVARALNNAAAAVMRSVVDLVRGSTGVLVTSDSSLLDRIGAHRDLTRHLEQLSTQVELVIAGSPRTDGNPEANESQAAALDDGAPDDGAPVDDTARAAAAALSPLTAVVEAVGALIPGLLSLTSARRSVSLGSATIDEQVAVAVVAGAILGSEGGKPRVLLDQTRLVADTTRVEVLLTGLGDLIHQLERRVLDVTAFTRQTSAKTSSDSMKTPAQVEQAAWVASATTVLDGARTALQSVMTVAPDQQLSPLAAAAANEIFTDLKLQHVLVVRPAGASTAQLVSDRPLAMKDPVHVAASVSLSFVLLHRATSRVLAAGLRSGESNLYGQFGSKLEIGTD